MTLAAHIDGPEDAPALVLLHAISTSSALWSPQVAVLASRFRVIRLDLPGHGASAALNEAAGFADYADDVAWTLSLHGVDRYVLAGLSFGAMVAMQVAVRHADHVNALCLACCSPKTPTLVAEAWRTRIAAVQADGMTGQIDPTLERWFTPTFASRSPATRAWVAEMIGQTPPAGFAAAAGIIAELDHLALLPMIQVPTLVLAGEHDRAVPLETMQRMADALPRARLQTLDAAHLANVEAPTAFTEALAAFAGEP